MDQLYTGFKLQSPIRYGVLVVRTHDQGILADRTCFTASGFTILEEIGPGDFKRVVKDIRPDIVLIIGELKTYHDVAICREICGGFNGLVVAVAVNDATQFESVILENGADDFISGRFSIDSLLARMKALIRRTQSPASQTGNGHNGNGLIRIGDLEINGTGRMASLDNREIPLTTAEFDLLWLLASRPNQIVSRDELYRELMRIEYDGLDRCVDLRVCRLRKKLGDCGKKPRMIKSVRSEGYVLVGEQLK
nr:winged helix-turn-helix domain-containing protein [candidate division Zixibacteria bacterium]